MKKKVNSVENFKYTTAIKMMRQMTATKRVVQGGSSAGKTYGIIPILIDKAARYPNREISIVSETVPHLRRGALKDFLKIMKATGRYNPDNYNKSHLKYEFSNGSYIEFFSADDESRQRGARRTDLYINEANNINFDAYHQLAIRTSDTIWIDFNPTAEFWAHTEVLTSDDSELLVLNYTHNEACPESFKKEVETAREKAKDNPYWENWVRVYVDGELGSLQGTVFQFEIIDDVPNEARWKGTGLDWGYTNDPTAAIDMYEWNGGVVFDEVMYDMLRDNDMGIKDVAEKLKSVGKNLQIAADTASPLLNDELETYGCRVLNKHEGKLKIVEGIDLMQERKIYVTKQSVNLIKELRNYVWAKDKTGKSLNQPIDAFNHGIDAARYIYTYRYHNKYSGNYTYY